MAYSVFLKVLGQAGERVVQLTGGFAGAVEVTKDRGNSGSVRTTSAGVRPASISVSASPRVLRARASPKSCLRFAKPPVR